MLAMLLKATNSGTGGKMIHNNLTRRTRAFRIAFELSVLKMVLAGPSRAEEK